MCSNNIYWVFGLVAANEELGQQVVQYLNKHQIGTRPFFWCMHEQPVFKQMGLFNGEKYPVAEQLARNGFYIPSGLGLKEEEVLQVVKLMLEFES